MACATVLERLGHEVVFPPAQTCCGQPPFNVGDWDSARAVACHHLDAFDDAEHIVAVSGSCGAMMRVFYPELFKDDPLEEKARQIAQRTWEFSDFLVNVLKIEDVGAKFEGKVTIHSGCHGMRELGIYDQPRKLLRNVRGLEIIEMGECATCCGFGGLFSVKFPAISGAMGETKAQSIIATGADIVVSNDMSCLMQIAGVLDRLGHPRRMMHTAQILACQ